MLDWLFPPSCVNCQAPGVELCETCKEKINTLTGRLCPVCGIPQRTYAECGLCQQTPPAFETLRSWAVYDGVVKAMVHALKYHGRLSMALPLGQYLADYYTTLNWEVDLIVPVPISPRRQRQRGYNQAAAIARSFQRIAAIPIKINALGRLKHTISQVGLNVKDRFENVNGAFWSDPKHVKEKRILVIDDVCTSSATMRACAEALKKAGASKVYGLTVARAGYYQEQQITLVDDLPAV